MNIQPINNYKTNHPQTSGQKTSFTSCYSFIEKNFAQKMAGESANFNILWKNIEDLKEIFKNEKNIDLKLYHNNEKSCISAVVGTNPKAQSRSLHPLQKDFDENYTSMGMSLKEGVLKYYNYLKNLYV